MVIGLLGIIKAGGAYVPLDLAYPQERRSFMLKDAQIALVLTQGRLVEELCDLGIQTICIDTDWESIAGESAENPISGIDSSNLAYAIYTSGSTGLPKAVAIQHSGLMNLVAWHQRAYNVTPACRATQIAGPAFDASVWELWPYLTAGAGLYIPSEATRTSTPDLLKWLADKSISICFLPTPIAETMLKEQGPSGPALKTVLTGGDQLHRVEREELPFTLINHYGPTENTVVATCAEVAIGVQSLASPPIGRPISNTQVYLLDEQLQPVVIGAAGELYIGGDGLARGYLNQPELTAEKFIPNPFSLSPGERLYRTGDQARYRPDGNIEFLGRIDNQVKIRGLRIELGEVEMALSTHMGVREAVVIVQGNGLSDKRLAAYIIADQKQAPAASELRSFLMEKLPDYMVPSVFIMLESLPLTPNGKLDRRGARIARSITA